MRWIGPEPPHIATQSVHNKTPGSTVHVTRMQMAAHGIPQLYVVALDLGSGGDKALIKGDIENAICWIVPLFDAPEVLTQQDNVPYWDSGPVDFFEKR